MASPTEWPTGPPATVSQGTVVAEIDGQIEHHPWVDLSDADAYSMFNTESELMGHSSTSDHDHPWRYLWGMNDAWFRFQPDGDEGPPIYPPGQIPLAMVQLGIGEPERPPVEPILRCLSNSLGRFGSVTLRRVSVAVAVTVASTDVSHGFDYSGEHRFMHCDPKAATTCQVDVKSSAPVGLEDLSTWELRPLPFRFRSHRCDPRPVESPAWLHAGPMLAHTSVLVDVPEWSVDAAAWVISMIAGAGGFATDAVVSVTPVS